jgi:AcrR family transcriptional regulator
LLATSEQETVMADAANRKKIIEALLTLLTDRPIERIGLGDIATEAGASLADLRD